MKDINTIKQAVTKLLDARMKDPTMFETFSRELLDLGVDRLVYDAIRNDMTFYGGGRFICSLVRSDLESDMQRAPWSLGKEFNSMQVQKAIQQLDSGAIEPVQFHREIFSAGVVMCCVYLVQRKIYYLGSDAQHFIEQY